MITLNVYRDVDPTRLLVWAHAVDNHSRPSQIRTILRTVVRTEDMVPADEALYEVARRIVLRYEAQLRLPL